MKPNMLFIKSLIVLLLSATAFVSSAQTPSSKPGATTTVTPKFKPPVVKSYLGKNTGNTATVTVEEGKDIISLPLKVTDEKNNTYTVSSYQFSFKRVGVTEDEETGKTSPTTDMVADRFTTTPLPEIWKKTIKETLVKGEEFYFFDIIVLDKQGRRFFAPELKIFVQ